ncbi:GH1 family beta-glucosidase [Mariniluteicoccus flavus]
MGLTAYRLSTSWPRVFPQTSPEGLGAANPAGVAFYRNLLEAVRSKGIQAFVTLNHWDLPETLQQAGGWASRRTAELFAEYAGAMAELLGDLEPRWITINEPGCIVWSGHWEGTGAPGVRDAGKAVAAAHHVNLAHGLGVQAIRAAHPGAHVSVAVNPQRIRPATDDPADIEAALDLASLHNEIFLDPMLAGTMSDRVLRLTQAYSDWGFVRDGDLAIANQPLDAVGLNYYSPNVVRHGRAAGTSLPGCEHVESVPMPGPRTDMGWPIDPSGLTEMLVALDEQYPGQRWMVTENGIAVSATEGDADERLVHDERRIDYLRDHIAATLAARDAGVGVDGYFCWSLMDNFEWSLGFAKRFGLVHVDYATGERTVRDSGRWYADHIRAARG